MPVVPGTSFRPPTWYQTHSETTGACRASRAWITSPLLSRRVAGTSMKSVEVGILKGYGVPPNFAANTAREAAPASCDPRRPGFSS